jgi:OCT family organic cation transporter-like MFS transporter 4/5
MVGGVLFGHLADKFGRKPVMMISLIMPVVVGVATSYAPWYSVFVTLRFVQGVLMQVSAYYELMTGISCLFV